MVEVGAPKPGEVLVEGDGTGICHNRRLHALGHGQRRQFPAILGHEGAGIVREVGAGVTSVKPGDHVIPLLHARMPPVQKLPQPAHESLHGDPGDAGQGVMPDGTSRFSCVATGEAPRNTDGVVFHYMGCSTFSNFTVLPEIAVAKVREDGPLRQDLLYRCGVTTGIGAVINTAKVWPGANVAVFGLGGIGLNVIQGARMVGADKIIGIDLNPDKRAMAERFGMTHFVNPNEVGHDKVVQAIVDLTGGGADFSFERDPATSTSCARRSNAAIAAGASLSSSACRSGARDRHPAVQLVTGASGRGRPSAAPAADRRAQDRRLVHGGEDQYRRSHHPRDAARRDQSRVRPHARRQVDPFRSSSIEAASSCGPRPTARVRGPMMYGSAVPRAIPANPRFPGRAALSRLHAELVRRRGVSTYLEVGVHFRPQLERISCDTAIGVDPAFILDRNVAVGKRRLPSSGHERRLFRRDGYPRASPAGLWTFAFLDGLHQYEVLLRDFRNAEAASHKQALIAMHDACRSRPR